MFSIFKCHRHRTFIHFYSLSMRICWICRNSMPMLYNVSKFLHKSFQYAVTQLMQNTTTSISYLHNNSNPPWSFQGHSNLQWSHKSGVWVRMNVNAQCTCSSTHSKPHFHLTHDPDLKRQIIYFNKLKLFKVITTQKFHKKLKNNLNIQFAFHLTTA